MKSRRHLRLVPALVVALIGAMGQSTAAAQTNILPEFTSKNSSAALSREQQAADAVTVRIIHEGTALVPGRPSTLGVTFDIDPGWNLYWRNPGDSGLPITIQFTAPEGISIGEPRWPTPERHVLAGDILDYVYRRRVTLLFPIVASPSLSPSAGLIAIKAHAKWLVCKEACFTGERSIEISIPLATEAAPGLDAQLIQSARDRLPRAATELTSPMIHAAWTGRDLTLACTGADQLTFFPYEGEAQPSNALDAADQKAERLTLDYRDAPAGAPARGVLVVQRLGSTTYHLVEAPPVP